MVTKPIDKRTRYLIHNEFQMDSVRIVLFFTIFVAIIGMGLAYRGVWLTVQKLGLEKYDVLELFLQTVSFLILFELLILLPVVVVSVIYLTHRIVGPLVRIEKELHHLAEGNFDIKLSLRKSDELKTLASVINRIAEGLRKLTKESKLLK
ncbi:MAG: HAMP domain-containing protein [Candidatus Omnitrophica bacterium]|nr:HAMP domain-containing protein [Candidatus Omnitrophota bacterium]